MKKCFQWFDEARELIHRNVTNGLDFYTKILEKISDDERDNYKLIIANQAELLSKQDEKKKKETKLPTLTLTLRNAKLKEDEESWIICMNTLIQCVNNPCGHMITCDLCAHELQKKKQNQMNTLNVPNVDKM